MTGTVVVPTGTANIASVLAGLNRQGVRAKLASGPGDIEDAGRVILPGVGSFGAAMEAIDGIGLREVLVEHATTGRPLLAICLGMQLLGSESEESPGVPGLGVLPGRVTRIPGSVRIPQLGWNRIEPRPDSRFLSPGWAYFANSYRLSEIPSGWTGATTVYSGRFVSALERGNLLACQFHPELSGAWGAQLLGRWLRMSGGDG